MKGQKQENSKTRIEILESKKEKGFLPEIEDAEYVIDLLFEIGPVMHSGGGVVPLTFTEMQSWSLITGVFLTAWEALTIRRLSVEFARESTLSKNPERPAPWSIGVTDRASVADGIEEAFKKFAEEQKRK
jgi:hypothetical protein